MADDLTTALARMRAHLDHHDVQQVMGRDAPRAVAALEAVLGLHHIADLKHRPGLADFRVCNGCCGQWPCPTAQAVSAVLLPGEEKPDA